MKVFSFWVSKEASTYAGVKDNLFSCASYCTYCDIFSAVFLVDLHREGSIQAKNVEPATSTTSFLCNVTHDFMINSSPHHPTDKLTRPCLFIYTEDTIQVYESTTSTQLAHHCVFQNMLYKYYELAKQRIYMKQLIWDFR